MPLWVFLAAVLAVGPTNAARRRTFENNRFSIVEVIGPKRSGMGVIVGAAGQVLTSVEYVGRYEAKVKYRDRELVARVALADPRLKLALLEMKAPGSFPSVAVKLQEKLQEGSFVLALVRPHSRKPSVLVGRVRKSNPNQPAFAETDLALPAGQALFDEKGRLVAVVVQQHGRRGSSVVPVATLKAQLAASITE
jgi:hypothetical protein